MLTAQSARSLLCFCLFVFVAATTVSAQATPAQNPLYARTNSFGIFVAYSNDSSHILLGNVEQRKLLHIGASYSRRLVLNHALNWQYDGEILPVALESDPLTKDVTNQTAPVPIVLTDIFQTPGRCVPGVTSYNFVANGITYAGTATQTCNGREWTIGEAISPIGMQWNFLPGRKLQPLFEGHGGYMYSTHPIPVTGSGSFNFTFELGAGFEYYRSHNRSLRFEYRYHHISNHGTAPNNPGIDNGLFQVSYVFGS